MSNPTREEVKRLIERLKNAPDPCSSLNPRKLLPHVELAIRALDMRDEIEALFEDLREPAQRSRYARRKLSMYMRKTFEAIKKFDRGSQ